MKGTVDLDVISDVKSGNQCGNSRINAINARLLFGYGPKGRGFESSHVHDRESLEFTAFQGFSFF